MPIQTYSSFTRVTKLCGARVPASLADQLASIGVSRSNSWKLQIILTLCSQHDDQEIKDFGVKLAVEIIQKLRSEGGINGFHFCTLNLEKSVHRVLEILDWAGILPLAPNKLIAVRILSKI